jgi:hypothetical protein
MVAAIMQCAEITEPGTPQQFSRIRHIGLNQDFSISDVCIRRHTKEAPVQTHDTIVNLHTALVCSECPTFQSIQEFAHNECVEHVASGVP